MPLLQKKFGQTTIAKVSNSHELKQVLDDPWLESETIIIKPNWVSTEPGGFTNADILRMVLEALDSHIVVTESLHIGRSMNILKEGMNFKVQRKEVNWRWLLHGDGWKWLVENPGWDWFRKEGHWKHLREEDEAFLEEYGFKDLFQEFDVKYINVTDEVWNGRIANPTEVKRIVESRYPPFQIEKMYSMLPKKLYDLQGSTFISLARLKQYATFTLKNIFGLIPDPLRPWWHGPGNSKIAKSIVDITKLYQAIFNLYGICTSLNTTAVIHPEGALTGEYGGKYNLIEGLGVVAFGRDLVNLDAILLKLTEKTTYKNDKVNRAPIEQAKEEGLGTYSLEVIEEAKKEVGSWLSPE